MNDLLDDEVAPWRPSPTKRLFREIYEASASAFGAVEGANSSCHYVLAFVSEMELAHYILFILMSQPN